MMNFEVYRKRGRHWEYLGVYDKMEDSNKAARKASYIHNIKVVGVRPEGSRDKILVYRFQYVAGITG
jgi:hypothetical protein